MYRKLLLVGVVLLFGGNFWLLAQNFTVEGVSLQAPVSQVIEQLESKYGAGQWLEAEVHYQIHAQFLGQAAVVELFSDDAGLNKISFSWQDELPYQQSLAYWQTKLYHLLQVPYEVDIFDATHRWRLAEQGVQLSWHYSLELEESTQAAPLLQGSLQGEGKSKRLYSIDGEEYESSYAFELDNVVLGEDQSVQVTKARHRVEVSFFPVIQPIEVQQESSVDDSTVDVPMQSDEQGVSDEHD